MNAVQRCLCILFIGAFSYRAAAQAEPVSPAPGPASGDSMLHLRLGLGAVKALDLSTAVPSVGASLTEAKDSVLVLNFWRTDCPPCVDEFPALKSIFQEPHPGSELYMVTESLDLDAVRRFQTTHRARIPDAPMYVNTDRKLRFQLRSDTVPLTLLLDRRRVVRQVFVGAIHRRPGGTGSMELQTGAARLALAEAGTPRSLLEPDVERLSCDSNLASQLMHRRFDITWLPGSAQPRRVNAVFLRNDPASCTNADACRQEFSERLPGIFREWKGDSEVQLWLLTSTQQRTLAADPQRRDLKVSQSGAAGVASLLKRCEQQGGLTLLFDKQQIVRQVFIGPLGPETAASLVQALEHLSAKEI